MAVPAAFVSYCSELLAGVGRVRGTRMFGGHGFYADEVFVAIAVGETLYLKVDDATRPRFEAEGCVPFAFTARGGRRQVLGFWSVPPEAMDSPALMRPWARLALEAALRARAAPGKGRKPSPPRR